MSSAVLGSISVTEGIKNRDFHACPIFGKKYSALVFNDWYICTLRTRNILKVFPKLQMLPIVSCPSGWLYGVIYEHI